MTNIESLIKGHHDRNRELLEWIASKGVDPNLPRDIDLHFCAFGEEAACNLSEALEARGYSSVQWNCAATDSALYNVETRVRASPVSVAEPAFVEDLARLADANDGEFDGWGTSI